MHINVFTDEWEIAVTNCKMQSDYSAMLRKNVVWTFESYQIPSDKILIFEKSSPVSDNLEPILGTKFSEEFNEKYPHIFLNVHFIKRKLATSEGSNCVPPQHSSIF